MGCSSSSQKKRGSSAIHTPSLQKTEIPKYKVVLLGDSSVGKTSLVNRYISDLFDESTSATVGSSYSERLVRTCKDKRVTLSIWDTGGQERYRCLAPLYYREAAAAILVFSVTDRATLTACDKWIQELRTARLNCLIFIAANKVDTPTRQISEEEGQAFGRERSVGYFEVSAKSGIGVAKMFTELAERLVNCQHDRD